MERREENRSDVQRREEKRRERITGSVLKMVTDMIRCVQHSSSIYLGLLNPLIHQPEWPTKAEQFWKDEEGVADIADPAVADGKLPQFKRTGASCSFKPPKVMLV